MPPFYKETGTEAGVEREPGDTATKRQGRTETWGVWSCSSRPSARSGTRLSFTEPPPEERGSGPRRGRSVGKLSARVQCLLGSKKGREFRFLCPGEVGRPGRNDWFIPEGTAESQGAPIRIPALMRQSCRPGAAAVTECPSATCVDGNF